MRTIVIGCLFHWKQANRRKLINLNFDDAVIQRLMRSGCLDILTVIPHGEIFTVGFEFIRQRLADYDVMEKLDSFFTYFRATWMQSYSPSDWNIHEYFNNLDIANRTNNPLERHNRRLNELFNRSHPNILHFAEQLRTDCEERYKEYRDIYDGIAEAPRHRSSFVPDSSLISEEYRAFRSGVMSAAYIPAGKYSISVNELKWNAN